jgi:hypothetical protein
MSLNKRVLLLVSILVVMLDGCYRYPGRHHGGRHGRRAAATDYAPFRR